VGEVCTLINTLLVLNVVMICCCTYRKLRAKVEHLSSDLTGRYDSTYWYYQPAEDRIPGYIASKVAHDVVEEGAYWEFK